MAMALSNSLILSKSRPLNLSSGFCPKSGDQSVGPTKLSLNPRFARNSSASRSSLVVQAKYRDNGGGSANAFVGGFILGGLLVGTIGCVFAPQISYALAEAQFERKKLMKKLPKFIHDGEIQVEKNRKKLEAKVEEINKALTGLSTKMRQ